VSQRFHRLDLPQPAKNELAGSDDVLYELNGDEASTGWATCSL